MENLFSIIIYLLIFTLSSFLIYKGLTLHANNKLRFLLIAFGILLPSILAGLRFNVGTDYAAYLKMFTNVANGLPIYSRPIEPASVLIITLSANLQSSFLLFFSFNLIANICFFLAFWQYFKKENRRIAIAFFFYLCILFPTTLNAIRSGAAISIITLAICILLRNWSNKNIARSIILIITAALFHKSSLLIILFIPVIWLIKTRHRNRIKIKKIAFLLTCILTSIFAPLIYATFKNILPLGDYSRYLTEFGNSFSIPLANIVMSIPIFYAIFYLRKNQKSHRLDELLYYAIFYIPLSILIGWLTYAKGLSRISFLLEPLIILLMAYLITLPQKVAKIWRITATICVASVVLLMFVRNLYWSKAIPYKTIFQKEISYEAKN